MLCLALMDTLAKADIFFFITSIAVVVLTVLISIVLYYFIRAGRTLHRLSEALQEKFAESNEFVAELKDRLESNPIFRLFFPSSVRHKRISAKNKKDN